MDSGASVEIRPFRKGYRVLPVIVLIKIVHNVCSALLWALLKYDTLIPEKAMEELYFYPFFMYEQTEVQS